MSIPSLPGNPPALVGRERELGVLRQHLDAVISGRGSLVLIGGEAGIGKTALAEAICREAADKGALVLVGRCYDLTETPPYGPWLEIFDRYQPSDGGPLGSIPAPPAAFATPGTVGAVADQAALFRQVFDFFATLARQRPLLLLLEDLHWADPASLDLLRALARRLADAPIVVLATYRADELTRRHPFFALIPALEREAGAALLDLRRLSPDAVRALVAARYGLPEGDETRLVDYLAQRAEGNAFFAMQLLRALEEDAILRRDAGGWALADLGQARLPSLLRQVLESRVARLGEEAQRLLRIGAVIGQDVPFALWAAVAEAVEEALLGAMETAADAHLVELTEEGFRFAHALVRETLHQGVLPPRRRLLHRRIAEALLAMPQQDVEAIAHHLREAGDPRAVEWLIRAGDRALAVFAWRSALAYYEAAHHLAEMHGLEVATDPHLQFQLARANRYVDLNAGAAYLERAEEWASGGHRALGSYAVFYRGLLLTFAREFQRGIEDMEQGVAMLDALTADERRGLWAYLARMGSTRYLHPVSFLAGRYVGQGRYRDARTWAERALRQADEGSDAVPLGASPVPEAATTLTDVYAAQGEPEAARAASARAREASRAAGDYLAEALATINELVWVALPYRTERLAERHRLGALAEAALRRVQDEHPDLPPRYGWLPVLLLEGPWDEARSLCIAGRDGTIGAIVYNIATRLLGTIALHQGDTDLVWSLVREALPEGSEAAPGNSPFPTVIVLQRLAAAASIASGDLAGAATWLRAHERWLGHGDMVLGRADTALLWAAYHRAAGDTASAFAKAREALTLATEPRQPLALIAALRLLGELETEAGHHDAARQHLVASLALADACAVPYERVLTLLALGELNAAEGGRDEATAHVDAARPILHSLGARPALARADDLAARLATMRDAKPSLPAGLTAREAEVLALLAQGKSNREIADALFLSEHTVHIHVRHIYQKTRTDNRAAATAFALRHGLA